MVRHLIRHNSLAFPSQIEEVACTEQKLMINRVVHLISALSKLTFNSNQMTALLKRFNVPCKLSAVSLTSVRLSKYERSFIIINLYKTVNKCIGCRHESYIFSKKLLNQ